MLDTLTFADAFARITSQVDRKRDKDVSASAIHVAVTDDGEIRYRIYAVDNPVPIFDLVADPIAQRQIGTYIGMPAAYWDKCAEAPQLLRANISHWLSESNDVRKLRMLLDAPDGTTGRLRAMLSNRYKCMDDLLVLKAVAPQFSQPGWRILECAITEKRFYLSAVSTVTTTDIRPGDTVASGVTISNSEVGHGALTVETAIFRQGKGTSILIGDTFRRNHVGRAVDPSLELEDLLSDETRKLEDDALVSALRDVVGSAIDEARFLELAATLRDAAATPIKESPLICIDVTAKRYAFTEAEKDAFSRLLFAEPGLTRYDVANALAGVGRTGDNYDRAVELSRAASDVLTSADDRRVPALQVA